MPAEFVAGALGPYDSDNDQDSVVTVPVGTADGDLMVALHPGWENSGLTPPTGFTVWPTVNWDHGGGAGMDFGVSYKIASGETGGSTTYSLSSNSLGSAAIMVFRNMNAPTSPVTGYDNTQTSGDWQQGLDSSSPVSRVAGSKSDLAVAQPFILIGWNRTTTGGAGGTSDAEQTGWAASIDQGNQVYQASVVLNSPLHEYWTINLVDKGVARPLTTFTTSWTGNGGALYGNGHFNFMRLYGATEIDTNVSGDAWGWIG